MKTPMPPVDLDLDHVPVPSITLISTNTSCFPLFTINPLLPMPLYPAFPTFVLISSHHNQTNANNAEYVLNLKG